MLKDLFISKEAKRKIDELREGVNVVGLSGGKDSMATCILLHWLEIPFQTVTAEVWWKNGISGEHPKHFEFLRETMAPRLKSWGVKCEFVRSEITAYQYMTTPIVKSKDHPERIGKLRGFPLCGKCGIQRDCKTRPCEAYYHGLSEGHNEIFGIAKEEEKRLNSMTKKKRISILEILGLSCREAYLICASEGLLSPTYTFSERGGCWFCPNQKIQELEMLYREYPHLWEGLMEVQRMPNKVTELFNRTQTLYDIEKEIRGGVQMRIFTGMLMKEKKEDV